MKAIVVNNDKSMTWSEVAEPTLGPDQVLVKVHYAGVNRADLMQRDGHYPPPPGVTSTLGLEFSGEVQKVGSGARDTQSGRKVFGLVSGGAYAEYLTIAAVDLIAVPEGMTMQEAASIPEAFFTAYLNLVFEGGIKAGENILVHAAASGVGLAAVQLSCAWGANVFGTAGAEAKCRSVEAAGAASCLNYKTEAILSFQEKLGKSPFDFILNLVGAATFPDDVQLCRQNGRIVLLSLLSGAESDINLASVVRKRLTIKGSTLRNRSDAEKTKIRDEIVAHVLPLFANKKLRTFVDKVFPISAAEEAHDYVSNNLNTGKVVLKISE